MRRGNVLGEPLRAEVSNFLPPKQLLVVRNLSSGRHQADVKAAYSAYNLICKTQKGEGMANAKQIALLKSGVAAWNAWREENPDEEIDVREARLSGIQLVGADLSGASLVRVKVEKAKYQNARSMASAFGTSKGNSRSRRSFPAGN